MDNWLLKWYKHSTKILTDKAIKKKKTNCKDCQQTESLISSFSNYKVTESSDISGGKR